MWRIVRLAALALIVALGPAALDNRQAKTGEAARLQTIVDEYFTQRGNVGISSLALSVSPDRNAALSLARAREQALSANTLLKKIHSVRTEELGHDDWLTYSVLEFELALSSEADKYFWLTIPITPYSSPLRSFTGLFEGFQFRTPDDLNAYVLSLIHI